MITYQKIGMEDIERILPLIVDFCIETDADDESMNLIINRFCDGKTVAFTAENGSICGIVGYIPAGERAIPDFFYVVPDKRKGMIGGRLQRILEQHCRENGIKYLTPLVKDDKESLYTKIGFKRKFILLEKEIMP